MLEELVIVVFDAPGGPRVGGGGWGALPPVGAATSKDNVMVHVNAASTGGR